MKIHAIQTGTVALTSAWREGVGHGRRRLLHAIVDRDWTEPLPIYAFAIEHPEGVIVVDTGEDARASGRGYFAGWHPGLRAGRAAAGDRSAAQAARHPAGRRPLRRPDPPAHRPCRRAASLPRERNPRHAHRARVRIGAARAPARLRRE
jgi:hypothetical protein